MSQYSSLMLARTTSHLENPESIVDICRSVAAGESLTEYCRKQNLPYHDVVLWLQQDPIRYDKYRKALSARAEWFIERVIGSLVDLTDMPITEITDADGSIKPPSQWTERATRLVNGYSAKPGRGGTEISVKFADKLKAIELLGKQLGMFKEQIEHSGTVSLADMVTKIAADLEAEIAESKAT